MKNKLLIFGILTYTLFSCDKSDLLKPFGGDSVPPSVVTDVTYEPIAGGAIIKYVLPQDEDLSYVKAVFTVKGEERDVISSQYNSQLKIEGLPEINDYTVKLYSVDKSNNYSDPVSLVITPEESPVNVMRNSLKVEEDFGGFKIDFENPSKSELSIYVYQQDSLSDNMNFYEAKVFTQEKGTYQVIGLPNKTNNFEIYVRDHFENTSEPLKFEACPWREEYLDKKNFKYVGEPYVLDKDDWYSWDGRPENLWDDIVGPWNFAQTNGNGSYPHYFCIDLGKKVPIARILFQQRLGDSEIFNASCIKHFDVYGVAELPIINREEPFEGWIKLNNETFEVKRPSGRLPGDPLTTEDRQAAEEGIMFEIDTPFPRPEIRYIRFHFIDGFTNNMAILGELSFWAQWK